ncbi:FAD-dependent oxidoreductase [Cupriavidus sp. SK-4]|uniref:FAD-dependent oxidoreductase n=1 Tax=Cupriavidus sp. SK-4 TaxID=574750 RepID=UPI00350F445E
MPTRSSTRASAIPCGWRAWPTWCAAAPASTRSGSARWWHRHARCSRASCPSCRWRPGLPLAQLQPWAGLRPATPDGLPLVGPSRVSGLWLNLGHGALGFTLAMGSAGLLADRLAGRRPAIEAEDFDAARA